MTAQDLKNAILQLAVQGKLVPQNPNDEPASELLKRIKAEKERLIKEGKIKKEKPLQPISDEEIPFDIPESWVWAKLGELGETQTGSTPSKKEKKYWGGDIPFVQPANINEGKLSETEFFLTNNGIKAGRLIKKESILQVCIGTIGKCAINYEDLSCNQQINILTPYFCVPKYIQLVMSAGFFIDKMIRESSLTTIKIINKWKWEQLLLPIPPLAEQERIVAKIEELMPLVEEYGKAEERLTALNAEFPDKLRKSILQQAIQGKLTERDPADEPASELLKRICAEKEQLIKEGKIKKEKPLPPITEEEIPFEIPESWAWVRIGDIWSVINGDRGQNYPAKSTLSHAGIPFISALNLNGKTVINDDNLLCLSETQYQKLGNGKLVQGDIVVCIRGSLGKHGRYPFEKGAIASSLVILRSSLNETVLDNFLMLYLDAPLFFCEIKRFDNGTAQPNLAAKSLEKFLIPLPPLAEQQRIVDRVNELLAVCDELK